MKGIAHNGYKNDRDKHEELFTKAEIDLFQMAAFIVELLPENTPDGDLIRCHEVARIVGSLLKLPVQDGKYGLCDHSWLWTREPDRRFENLRITGAPKIIDPYCVGSLPVVRLLDSMATLPHLGWAYQPGKERNDVKKDFVEAEVGRIKRLL